MYDYEYDDADYADDDQGRMSVYDSIFVYFGGVYLECNNVCVCVCAVPENLQQLLLQAKNYV